MPKKHIFLQNGFSTLDDISLQNVIAHPAEFFVYWCLLTASWPFKKPQENKLDGLLEWAGPSKLLQNEHFKM